MVNIPNAIKEWVSGWVQRNFFPIVAYQQESRGTASRSLPIVLNPSGQIDDSFISAEYIADTVGAMLTGNTETGITVTYQDADNTIDFVVSAQDHGTLTGLADDDHAQYALLAGRATGQTLNGDTAANGNILIYGTSHATKTTSYVLLNPTGGSVGIGTTSPVTTLNVVGNSLFVNGTGSGGLGTGAGSGVRISSSSIFSYDYATATPNTLTLQSPGGAVAITGAATVGSTLGLTGDAIYTGSGTIRTPNANVLTLMAGTSATEGPYIAINGKDNAGAYDGAIEFVGTTESAAVGGFKFWNFNGAAYTEVASISATGNLQHDGTLTTGGAATIAGTLEVTGITTVQSILRLSMATQEYDVTSSTSALAIQSKTAAAASNVWFFSNDGDGTDNVSVETWGVGSPGSIGNRERLILRWTASSSSYELLTEAAGTGTVRPLVLYTGSNTNQLHLLTSGKVAVGMATTGGNLLGIKAGASANDAAVGGTLYVTTTAAGNVGAGEDDLASYTVPAATLNTNGQSLWFEAFGTLAGNANTKTVRVKFDGTNVFNSQNIGATATPYWSCRGRIIRTGAATQVTQGTGGGHSIDPAHTTGTTASTLANALVLKVTGEAVATDDIRILGFIVGYDDANT